MWTVWLNFRKLLGSTQTESLDWAAYMRFDVLVYQYNGNKWHMSCFAISRQHVK